MHITIEEIRHILEKHKDFLKQKYHVEKIAIFGSRARKEEKESSDIDIIIEFSEPIGWEVVELKEYLENLLNAKVDLITYKAVLKKPTLWNSIKDDLIYV